MEARFDSYLLCVNLNIFIAKEGHGIEGLHQEIYIYM